MQTKPLYVLIHIWTKDEVGAPLNWFSPPVKYFNDRSKAVLLLWFIYVISVLFCYAFLHVCLLMPCGHLLGKGWPLGSRLWCLIVTLSLSHWYPGSDVELDCIDSWSLPSFLLCLLMPYVHSLYMLSYWCATFKENPHVGTYVSKPLDNNTN